MQFLQVYLTSAVAVAVSEFLTPENIMALIFTNNEIRQHETVAVTMIRRFWQQINSLLDKEEYYLIESLMTESPYPITYNLNNNDRFMTAGGFALRAFTNACWEPSLDEKMCCADLDIFFESDQHLTKIQEFLVRNGYHKNTFGALINNFEPIC